MSDRAEVKVSFDASPEKRAGKLVMVITKTTTTTPVSGRGTEWSRSSRRTITQSCDQCLSPDDWHIATDKTGD